mmetsp:Transcript_27302/g.79585  ORF Transcript_27302/g.79585 Transcript_27302/m.79585 type:complete len:261 (-) Transcript_27302:395-1177(-)
MFRVWLLLDRNRAGAATSGARLRDLHVHGRRSVHGDVFDENRDPSKHGETAVEELRGLESRTKGLKGRAGLGDPLLNRPAVGHDDGVKAQSTTRPEISASERLCALWREAHRDTDSSAARRREARSGKATAASPTTAVTSMSPNARDCQCNSCPWTTSLISNGGGGAWTHEVRLSAWDREAQCGRERAKAARETRPCLTSASANQDPRGRSTRAVWKEPGTSAAGSSSSCRLASGSAGVARVGVADATAPRRCRALKNSS